MRRRTGLALTLAAGAVIVTACGSAVPPAHFLVVGQAQPVGQQDASPVAGQAAPNAAQAAPGAAAGQTATAPTARDGHNPVVAGSTGGGGGSGGGTNGSGGSHGVGGVQAGSCTGFHNGHGITDSTITIANASDVSGPVPGLFKSAQQATQAYVNYFNATSSICGRKLKLINLDSATSTTGDEQAATKACSDAFALVGSMGAFDSGGANTVTQCGIPDLRAVTVNPQRVASPVSFGTDSISVPEIPTAPFDYLKKIGGDAYQHAAFVYLNAGAALVNGKSFKAAEEKMGFKFLYTQAIDVTTFNYAPYVADMQSKGVKYVQWLGNYQNAIRLKQAMVQQGLNAIFAMDSVAYDQGFVSSGGSAVEGTYAFVDTALFEEQSRNPEMQLYAQWLQRAAPGAIPSFFGTFAWGATKLFAQLAVQLGGRLDRQSLLAAVRATHGYSANGLFAPQDVGGKRTTPCQAVIQLQGGHWVRKTPFPFTCGSLVNSGVNG